MSNAGIGAHTAPALYVAPAPMVDPVPDVRTPETHEPAPVVTAAAPERWP
eukprot:CAMPEP_0171945486 /NCGR_PEP_ID=MMETSP0993-20121228/48872_1 /TAXON_ID=483369 /ORGANISM="non described non described, Strain CCMP2098" /LENGTH=49 /DNA_ID=CAMNT_0012588581 /DNA_START=215 /DNA_END=364 /DNA_ORIENTATION=-